MTNKGHEESRGFRAGVWPHQLGLLVQVLKECGDDEGRVWTRALLGKAGLGAPWGEVSKEDMRASSSFRIFFTLFPTFPERVKQNCQKSMKST